MQVLFQPLSCHVDQLDSVCRHQHISAFLCGSTPGTYLTTASLQLPDVQNNTERSSSYVPHTLRRVSAISPIVP